MLHATLALVLCLPQGGSGADAAPDIRRGEHLRIVVTGAPGVVADLQRLGYDGHDLIWRRDGAWEIAEVIAPRAEMKPLRRALGEDTMIAVVERSRPYRDIARANGIAAASLAPDPNYRTPQEVVQGLRQLETQYPHLAVVYDLQSRYQAPFTHDNRRIYVMRVSDNPAVDEDEPSLLVFANNHARELNSIEAPFSVASRLLAGYATDPALRKIVDDNQIWILPNMNPDGLDYVWTTNNMWRKNRRNNGGGNFGVDLNRNYWFYWSRCGSSASPSSDTYHGPSAGSEPETRAMRAFTLAEGFERMIDIHSYSRDVRHPFNTLVESAVPSMVRNAYTPMHNAIAAGMNYSVRGTCCCGTHMEWHHATHGTLSFVVEMGTAFQPPWSETQTELSRMWPGFRALLERPVPMRGHVRSIAGSAPVVAQVTVAGQRFQHGQQVQSVGRFGRYHLWAGPGSYDVTFSASGHRPVTTRVNLTSGQTLERDIWLEPIAQPTTLTSNGAPRLGTTVTLDLSSPDDGGLPYFLPVSTAETPPISAGAGRQIPIAASPLLEAELLAPSVFINVFGVLDGQGRATGGFAIPGLPALIGTDFYFAGLTLDFSYPLGVKGITAQNVKLSVLP